MELGCLRTDMSIAPDCILCASTEQVHCKLADEFVILGMKSSTYYGLNPIASRIWELLQNPIRFDDVVKTLMEEYEVTQTHCENAVSEFILQLIQENLVIAQPRLPD